MLRTPSSKYRAFPTIDLADRRWPGRAIEAPPVWLSTDLRDGNQALFEPMDAARKLRLFRTLVSIGFKEIEVAFPAASQTDFDFVRSLIENDEIPDDVTIGVLTQAREPLIRRSMEALHGARRAIVHVYNATAPVFREVVFQQDRSGVIAIACQATRLIRELADRERNTEWVFQYSPETFSATELPFAKQICDAVLDIWQPTPARPAIINLPATVEVATANVYADQVEWMHRHLRRRDSIVLSVHPHNDRGCAVAATELALMAGADRVEGCLFGNGERTGNVDLVTLALNLYTQGISPGLDLSAIDDLAAVAQECTGLPIHPRHPYVGDLVYTAFSGSHQDAIRKGLAARARDSGGVWAVPYLPIDPADLGRRYDAIIRVNSQSGKGGVAHLLEQAYGLTLPRRLQIEFSAAVKALADASGGEIGAAALWSLFQREYLSTSDPWRLDGQHLFEEGGSQGVELVGHWDGQPVTWRGLGNGPLAAAAAALPVPVNVLGYEEHSLGQGADAQALAMVELSMPARSGPRFGVGLHPNIVTATLQALASAVNRCWAAAPASGLPAASAGAPGAAAEDAPEPTPAVTGG